jgi:hypothetical protein
VLRRTLILLAARLGAGPRGSLPVAALVLQGGISAALCALVADALPPFAYALFALSLSAALLAIPLLGELGWLLRSDEAEEWISVQPVRPAELRIARTLHLLLLVWSLALAALLPAAFLAPDAMATGSRALLPLLGLGLATLLAATLLAAQTLLGGRAEGLLVAFQTLVVSGATVGLVAGIRLVPRMRDLGNPGAATSEWIWAFAPTWFAAPLAEGSLSIGCWLLPLGVFLVSGALLLTIPAPAPRRRRGGELLLALLLRPIRALASRFWVRREERAIFDLVYDALPREREFVLRAYPMLGIPVAFLAAAASGPEGGSGPGRSDLLALLMFSAGVYLPILLTQAPGSASHAAKWLLEASPVSDHAIASGTIKAMAIRFIVPLYASLILLAALLGLVDLALRLALPGALASLAALRLAWPVCVTDRPLSVAPDRLHTSPDWFGPLAGIGIALALLAVLANRLAASPLAVAALVGALLLLEVVLARRTRSWTPRLGT